MENLSKFFAASMTGLIFVMAISILLITNREMNKSIALIKKDVQAIPVLYYTDDTSPNIKNELVNYHELISILMLELDYDIRINNKEIKKEDHNFLVFNFGSISIKDYKKSYEYDLDGKLVRIVYQ